MIEQSSSLPTAIQKRVDLLDILRGFAISGIFVVNIEIMNCTFINQDVFSQQWTSIVDRLTVRILQLFFYTKFFPIFSFLFGLGISMQALKRLEAGNIQSAFFFRRMGGLFIIGIAHTVFLWSGDVVHLYALLGMLIVYLVKKPDKLILTGAIVVFLFPYYGKLSQLIFESIGFNPGISLAGYSSQEITQLIRNGSYVEGMRLRMLEYVANIPILFVYLAPMAFSMFLLGLYAGKKKLIYTIPNFVETIKKPVLAVAVLTNAYRFFFLFVLLPNLDVYSNNVSRPLFFKLMVLSDVAMGLFYVWLIAWLYKFPAWQKILYPLKYVGQMALSNYIMQSLIGLLLFSTIGFQLYETLSPVQTLFTATVIFCFQVIFSKIWLNYFRFGPLEWVWRCFSYQKLLPVRKRAITNPVQTH